MRRILDRVIEIYRETMDLVTQESGGYAPPESNQEHQVGLGKPHMQTPGYQTPRVIPPVMPQGGTPMSVSFTGDRLQVSAVLEDGEAVDKLIKALDANKALLPPKREPGDQKPTI